MKKNRKKNICHVQYTHGIYFPIYDTFHNITKKTPLGQSLEIQTSWFRQHINTDKKNYHRIHSTEACSLSTGLDLKMSIKTHFLLTIYHFVYILCISYMIYSMYNISYTLGENESHIFRFGVISFREKNIFCRSDRTIRSIKHHLRTKGIKGVRRVGDMGWHVIGMS